jgi:hypothetical protein
MPHPPAHPEHETRGQGALGLWTALAGAHGAAGRFADARAALLRAIDLAAEGSDATRVRLVAECAGIEQTLGHHDDAHRRLVAALDALPTSTAPRPSR